MNARPCACGLMVTMSDKQALWPASMLLHVRMKRHRDWRKRQSVIDEAMSFHVQVEPSGSLSPIAAVPVTWVRRTKVAGPINACASSLPSVQRVM